ncbi:hypothetical protein Tco_0319191 [Tanacetum coccineum]
MDPTNTLLMGDEVISTIPAREIDEFIKSSVNDPVPVPRESEVTSDSISECDMSTPLPTTDVKEEDFDINSPLREQVVDFLMENVDVVGFPRHLVKEIDFNPCRDIEELEFLLANDPAPVPRVFDEPLGNFDSMSRPIETSDLILEELTTEIGLDNLISTKIDDRYHDSEGDILYFEQLLNEDASSDVSPAFTYRSGGKTEVMETPSFSSLYVPSPRPAAYSPTEVMYCYYHPHLTSEIPSGESKVHIEVLSVLWGNRLPIPDGSLPLSR